MDGWIVVLVFVVAATDLFLIPASFREYGKSRAEDAEEHRRTRCRRATNLAMIGLQVLFVLLLGVILLGGLPSTGAVAVLVLCVAVLVAEYRLSVMRDRAGREG